MFLRWLAHTVVLMRGRIGSSSTWLLDADPDLGADLTPSEAQDARRSLPVPVLEIPRGSWEPGSLLVEHRVRHILVLDGLLVRELFATGMRAAELIAPGDLFDLGSGRPLDTLVRLDTRWSAADSTRVALLTEGFMLTAARWPRLMSAFVARIEERSARLATQITISHLPSTPMRLLALLWHLAERFGKVGADHVVLPLRLPHRTLGAMIGAEHSTVTLALRDLTAAGLVGRRDDGARVLYGDRDESLTSLGSAADHPPAAIFAAGPDA
jgi:hypothetical protein